MATVEQIIDQVLAVGEEKAALADQYTQDAILQSQSMVMTGPIDLPVLVPPPAVLAPDMSALQGMDGQFDSISASITSQVSAKYAEFLSDFVSLNAALAIGVNVEQQIWARDRDRLTIQAQASAEEAVEQWAAKGYPMPAGAGLAAVQRIQTDRDAQIAQSSRDRAIKSWELEYDAAKFTLQVLSDLRVRAAQAAAEYVKAIALGPQVAADTIKAKVDGATALTNSLMAYYQATTRIYEVRNRVNVDRGGLQLDAMKADMATLTAAFRGRVDAAVAAADSVGRQAQAAMNAVNASAQRLSSE